MNEAFIMPPGASVKLSSIDSKNTAGYRSREEIGKEHKRLLKKLEELQEPLFAGKKHALLFVFQGMDCSGKDGVINHVFSAVNPQGLLTYSFKPPTPEEAAHDFLWRAHRKVPGKGYIATFNRSYYEDVLITRVHRTISDQEAARKFEQINAFEQLLTDSGVKVVKIFLHISKAFQLEKLIDRIETPHKNWKFDAGDLTERKSWDLYQSYYEDIFERCSSPELPWHIVPADHRWYRDFAVLQIVVSTLEGLGLSFPEPKPELKELLPELYRERGLEKEKEEK
ncbi:PPK2 family polyphosphate kinase [Paenibacillus jiagnxiensis]|uniref:PPK2 family polyphosphate kinase n=1 Tax=Paenibacillus jiagnxiensis TaxID=3228926 RepID=UPI00339EF3E4